METIFGLYLETINLLGSVYELIAIAGLSAMAMSFYAKGRRPLLHHVIGGAANTTGILAAQTDNGATQTFGPGRVTQIPFPSRVTATAGGTEADIKAIQVTVTGLDPSGNAISEALPAFTVNTAGTVTSVLVFGKILSISIPAHDGTGATTSIGYSGAPKVATAAGIHAAVTDTGAEVTVTTAISQPDCPRGITATSGGTAGDIKDIQVTINGLDADGNVISEVLPVFTENSATTVVGAKAFKHVTSIVIPAHDGTGATTAIGFSDVLGLPQKRNRKTVKAAWLADVLETTAPTELFSASAVSGNTVDLNSALNSVQVRIEFEDTRQG